MPSPRLALALALLSTGLAAQSFPHPELVRFTASAQDFPLIHGGHVPAIYLNPAEQPVLGAAVDAFASDIERVSGITPQRLTSLRAPLPPDIILIGVLDHSAALDALLKSRTVPTASIAHQWEAALTTTLDHPLPGVSHALVITGADRRGAAFALFTLSRQMGVSPWNWWADVPVPHHDTVFIHAHNQLQPSPSVQYRGIFLNDEDWGIRPWAAKNMDPSLHNIGPHTYARIFELLLRLHANSLWPAMHPGTLPFNAVPENAVLADHWGIVMGSSHSEALLRNNVGEWSEAAPPKGDGPWNYQLNRPAMMNYWEQRLVTNGKFENFYTVGLRGVHDTGLEATGDNQVKSRLVEQAMADQRSLLARHVNADLDKVPQVIWLYKESLALFRAGMQVPDDVTLGWTDDNYGYIRQLPTPAQQRRSGGSGIYYHVSYWGFPHDYLWLCSTPPSLIREELTKAFDHGVRRYWILNVGDLKPAESDIDYFLQLAWNEPAMAALSQHAFLARWAAEQFPSSSPQLPGHIASLLDRYYHLNFIRKPEFMGFNGYTDAVRRTDFNPLAWPATDAFGQNETRLRDWQQLAHAEAQLSAQLPAAYHSAAFELLDYPVQAAAAQNAKFLFTDRTFLDATHHNLAALTADAASAQTAYDRIQALTATYNHLDHGKWDLMMSASPRDREVFKMPAPASLADAALPLPASWAPDTSHTPAPPPGTTGFVEQHGTVSISAIHFAAHSDGTLAHWRSLPELGISAGSVSYGYPGLLAETPSAPTLAANAPWLQYAFTTTSSGPATLTLHLLPTFPIDSDHRLRFAVSIDGAAPTSLDLAGTGEWQEGNAPEWEGNVRRNSAILTLPVPSLTPGHHTLKLFYQDPGVVFEHLVLTFAGAPPAYPVPPESFLP